MIFVFKGLEPYWYRAYKLRGHRRIKRMIIVSLPIHTADSKGIAAENPFHLTNRDLLDFSVV